MREIARHFAPTRGMPSRNFTGFLTDHGKRLCKIARQFSLSSLLAGVEVDFNNFAHRSSRHPNLVSFPGCRNVSRMRIPFGYARWFQWYLSTVNFPDLKPAQVMSRLAGLFALRFSALHAEIRRKRPVMLLRTCVPPQSEVKIMICNLPRRLVSSSPQGTDHASIIFGLILTMKDMLEETPCDQDPGNIQKQ